MNPEKTLQSRINLLFGILCIPVGTQYVMAFLMQNLSGFSISPYVLDFVLPQAVLPLLNLLLVLFVWKILPRQGTVRSSFRRPTKEFFPWLGLFLGAVTVGNFANNLLLSLLRRAGMELPAIFSKYDPTSVTQGILFFVVIALLPSFSEEFLFRGFVGGGLQSVHPAGAIVLSAFAFGMMHATLQQLPFAFFMGLVFGLVYVRTSNLWYPIFLHLINNSWACAITFTSVWAGEKVVGILQIVGNTIFLCVGIASFFWLKKEGKLFFRDLPRSTDGKTVLDSTLTSIGFWSFTVLYVLLTVANYMAK